jgi:uncharacterized protein DUF6286
MPRGTRAGTALVVAVLAVAVCTYAAIEAITLATRERTVGFDVHAVTRYGRTTHWDATAVTVVGIIAAAIGLALLLAALLPPRRRTIELATDDHRLAIGISLPSLRRTLQAAVLAIDGVGTARVRGRRHWNVTATTTLRDATDLPETIRNRVTAELASLNPTRQRPVRVRLNRKDR